MQHRGLFYRPETNDRSIINEAFRDYVLLGIGEETILDVGAHIGSFAIWALEEGAKEVISFEPDPENYGLLLHNTVGKKVVAHNSAIVEEGNTIELWRSRTKDKSSHSIQHRRGRTDVVHVEATALRDTIRRYHPTVLKIDIEGGEFLLLPTLACLQDLGIRAVTIEFHFGRSEWRRLSKEIAASLNKQFTVRVPPKLDKAWNTVGIWAN